jgi:hypothetical protein
MILTETPSPVKTRISYDRSARRWLAINGTTSSHASKNEALLQALANDRPALYAVVKSLLKIHRSRTFENGILKAARLLVAGKVFANGEVGSQSRDGVYHTVTYGGIVGKYDCGCQATVMEPIIGKCCAHSLSQHLAYLAEIELPSRPHADLTDDTGLPF